MRIRLFLILTVFSAVVLAGGNRPIPYQAKIYIEPLPEDLHVYLKAEIIKKKIPVRIVGSKADAEFVLGGTAEGNEKRSWHEGWLTASKDKVIGAIQIINREEELIWADEAGDRSVWFGELKRGGPRKVAGRLAKKLKKAVQKK